MRLATKGNLQELEIEDAAPCGQTKRTIVASAWSLCGERARERIGQAHEVGLRIRSADLAAVIGEIHGHGGGNNPHG